jgi:protein gp37
MADNTKIEWCDATFNPWVGCQKVSPACDHCYAEGWAKRTGQSSLWAGIRRRTTPDNWRQPIKWNHEAERLGVRKRVFCASLADVFDNKVPPEWRHDLFRLIGSTPSLDWLLLTKRPQNIAKMLPSDFVLAGRPPHNVWLGTTVENQAEANRRIHHLRAVPAAVRFLSCEPLLDLIVPDLTGVAWVICGGESGGGARKMQPMWARALRDDCAAEGVAFFMKQMTKKAPIPDDLMVREFPA